jgi:hypothetical protein
MRKFNEITAFFHYIPQSFIERKAQSNWFSFDCVLVVLKVMISELETCTKK